VKPTIDMPWLPRLQPGITDLDAQSYSDIEIFCKNFLGMVELQKVSAIVRNSNFEEQNPWQSARIRIFADDNMPNFEVAIEGTGPRYSMNLSCEISNFRSGTLKDESRKDSNAEQLDLIVILFSEFSFPDFSITEDNSTIQSRDLMDLSVEASRAMTMIREATATTPHVVIATVPCQNLAEFGHLDKSTTNSRSARVAEFNHWIQKSAKSLGAAVLDLEALSSIVGYENWIDKRLRNMAGYQLSPRVYPLLADHLVRLFSSMIGKSRRVLVLDLDNTLWGGILGDDGIEQIVVGIGDPIGEAYLEFQTYVKQLKQRGVVLAISSKNYSHRALEAIDQHPSMQLRTSDFAAILANWDDKAENIRKLSSMLNLGLSSFVFVDDSPIERERVRSAIPEVLVLEMPPDPVEYTRYLQGAGCFETVSLTSEDYLRAADYLAVKERDALQVVATSHDEFLESLQTVVGVSRFKSSDQNRIFQLVHKSNQFNLTTIRYSRQELIAMEDSQDVVGLSFRLSDRISDSGIISIVVLRVDSKKSLKIDTWLMSCRVLNRGVEEAVLDKIMQVAKSGGFEQVIGVYRQSEKNQMVEKVYPRLGFSQIGNDEPEQTTWVRDVATYESQCKFIDLKDY
jgi:FkbH-like protein